MSTEGRDAETIRRFVERFAAMLVETGWPRMAARVFIALLATDAGGANAAELAETLQVSPAAISGAVRMLSTLGLASREREPGSRRDYYRVHDDVWYEAIARRDQTMQRWTANLREGMDVLGADTPAGLRLGETLSFFEFLDAELPKLFEKWKSRRAALRNP